MKRYEEWNKKEWNNEEENKEKVIIRKKDKISGEGRDNRRRRGERRKRGEWNGGREWKVVTIAYHKLMLFLNMFKIVHALYVKIVYCLANGLNIKIKWIQT